MTATLDLDKLQGDVREALRGAADEITWAALTDGPQALDNPYDEIVRVLQEGIDRALFLKTHTHEWGEDDYCVHCLADGRA